ncbi:hypothetical protein [Sphingobium baderi]|uniref:Uncharacterized protein n=1 Tax=Sphingobium baderi LL03 TaxID=1114964 RepID=T0G9Z8_9SPHN|nr:hypothetical protein [Sphingobium baderi]EQA96817.1 hypothetical protein L485_22300 [Sphingobium baderi LL03]KMS64026.1 hypothetical protein V475_23230 [Sphingobium baderi LL03]
MANDMVELVARAIHDGRSGIPWEITIQQDLAYRDARAALKALREPTPEMVDAGRAYFDGDFSPMHAENCWSAMLSAAIGEG